MPRTCGINFSHVITSDFLPTQFSRLAALSAAKRQMQVALVISPLPSPYNPKKQKKNETRQPQIHSHRSTDWRRRLLALPSCPFPSRPVSVGSTCLHVFVTHVYLHEKEITPHTWPEHTAPSPLCHSLCNQIVRKGMKSYFYT